MKSFGLDLEIRQAPGNRIAAGQAFNFACTISPGKAFVPRHTHLLLLVTHEDDVPTTVLNCAMAKPFIYQAPSHDPVARVVGLQHPVLHNEQHMKWELPDLMFSTACVGHSYQLGVEIITTDPTTGARASTGFFFHRATRVSQAALQIGGSQAMPITRQSFSAAHLASDYSANGQKTILAAPQRQLTMGGANNNRVIQGQPEQRKDGGV